MELPQKRIFVQKLIKSYLPITIASFEAICFGLMLGWPSPMYPKLLAKDSPVYLTLDQTAPIAGFLMFGVIIATPFSKWSPTGSKNGIIVGVVTILLGWIIMRLSRDYLWLFGSRIIVGLGHGYGLGQLKIFINENSDGQIKTTFTKLINLYVFIGVVVAFSVGPFTTFWSFSTICIIITGIVLILLFMLPQSSKMEFYELTKEENGLLNHILAKQGDKDVQMYEKRFVKNLTVLEICKDRRLLKKIILFTILTFFQQYSGVPPLTVYSQIIFESIGYSHSNILAIIFIVFYCTVFFLFSFKLTTLHAKTLLIYSSVFMSITLWLLVASFHYDFEKKFPYISLFLILFVVYVHSLGLGVVPFKLVSTFFPLEVRDMSEKLHIMLYSFFALTCTKIFQVLYGIFGLEYCFLFSAVVTTISIGFILFLPDELDQF